MKCKYCDGDGVIVDAEYAHTGKYTCGNCDGTGVVEPRTNDEWRKTCSAEEFAEWISNLAYACMRCGMSNGEAYCHTGYCIQDEEDAERWLRRKHK